MSGKKLNFGKLYSVREIKDLKDMLYQSGNLFAKNNAFMVKNDNGSYKNITYTQFKSDTDALGTALISLGLKDAFIAVIGENRYEWCLTYLSVTNGTGVIVPLDKELPKEDLDYILIKSNASAIVFSGKHIENIKKFLKDSNNIKYFINMDSEIDDGKFLSFNRLLEKGRDLIKKGNREYIDTCRRKVVQKPTGSLV